MRVNPLLRTDSYKISHPMQYPPNMTAMYDYVEARNGGRWNQVLFFGLQKFIKDYLLTPITKEDVVEADEFYAQHLAPGVFNSAAFNYIVEAHEGYFPVQIRAVKEGAVLPTGTVLVTVESTDSKAAHVVSFLETALLRDIWYGSTVATNSWMIKQTLRKYLEYTSDHLNDVLPYQLHDFGARGVSSGESAQLGGMAHLVNFRGSDTLEGISAAMQYYNCGDVPGVSIPASEHSTITAWGDEGTELMAFSNLLDSCGHVGRFACVCDSYDLEEALAKWGQTLKARLLESESCLVVRPDSGDPVQNVLLCLRKLERYFGSERNSKGYLVLNPAVRVIQGDGINEQMVKNILQAVKKAGYSTENVAFGSGGGLLQKINRDTLRFAMKVSAVQRGGVWTDVCKNPVTDRSKASKAGLVSTYYTTLHDISKVEVLTEEQAKQKRAFGYQVNDMLETVYKNGKLLREQTLDQIRSYSEVNIYGCA